MNENLTNNPGIDPAQLPEAAVASNAEELRAEIAGQVGSVAHVAEVAEPQVNPTIEHMKKVERAFFGNPESLIEQIDNGEIGVDDTDFEDRTPTMMMTAQGRADIVEALFARGADPNRMIMFQGRIPMSALDAARQTKRKDLEQLLLDNGAKSGRELEAERIAAEQNK